MNDIVLKLDKRTAEGKKIVKLRRAGLVPGIVYGGHDESIMVQSPEVETVKVVRSAGKHSPVNLLIDGKKKLAIIKSIDFDPVKHTLRHVAYHTIKQNEVITTQVPVVLLEQSTSPAERAGLVILQAIESIEIKAKPADLPESIEVSCDSLATAEDKITIGDIKLPNGVEFADIDQDMDLVIANVYEPSALQAANEAAGGEAESESEVETEESESVEPESETSDQA